MSNFEQKVEEILGEDYYLQEPLKPEVEFNKRLNIIENAELNDFTDKLDTEADLMERCKYNELPIDESVKNVIMMVIQNRDEIKRRNCSVVECYSIKTLLKELEIFPTNPFTNITITKLTEESIKQLEHYVKLKHNSFVCDIQGERVNIFPIKRELLFILNRVKL